MTDLSSKEKILRLILKGADRARGWYTIPDFTRFTRFCLMKQKKNQHKTENFAVYAKIFEKYCPK